MWLRRAAAVGALISGALIIGGCGFQPLNTYRASTDGGRTTAALSAIAVQPIRNRSGQILRNALLDRLDPRGTPEYTLTVTPTESIGSALLSRDSTATRRTFTIAARFQLKRRDGVSIVRDSVRSETSYDVARGVANAFADVAGEHAARQRVSDAVADRIVLRLGFALVRESQ